jgi:hypothetical protein
MLGQLTKGWFVFGFMWLVIFFSCEDPADEISRENGLQLIFSNDSIIFDTLFTERTSITKRLRIINPNKNAIEFSRFELARGSSSPFELTINGSAAKAFSNLVINGRDSLLILCEATIDPNDEDEPFLLKDSLLVNWNEKGENIKVLAWGQNARYIRKGTICSNTWTNERPYVILDTLLIEESCELTIQKGSRIFFDNNAAIFVAGTLKVEGDSAEVVHFRSARTDSEFINAPGQWDAIYFLEGSQSNLIEYALIENARIGLRVGTPDEDDDPDLVLNQVTIRNVSEIGLQSFNSDISASNMLIYNFGQFGVFHGIGGTYHYDHITVVNIPGYLISENPVGVFADNLILGDGSTLTDKLTLSLYNSVFWGQTNVSVEWSLITGENEIVVQNNLFRQIESLDNNFVDSRENYPGFVDIFSFDYRPASNSFMIDRGVNRGTTIDLIGVKRDALPDLGAFEFINQ